MQIERPERANAARETPCRAPQSTEETAMPSKGIALETNTYCGNRVGCANAGSNSAAPSPSGTKRHRVLRACLAALALGFFSGFVSAQAESIRAPCDRMPTSTASPPAIAADEQHKSAPPAIGETCTITPYCCAVTCCRSGDTGTGGTPKCIEQCCAEYCEHLICK